MSTSPFDHNHANPWTSDFIDLPELNARTSNTVAAAIERVRESARGDRTEIASESLLVLGPAGAGKTHLFVRLRKKVGPRAVFVHLRPLIGTQMTPRYVMGEIVRQLDYEAQAPGGGFRQLDALVGAILGYLRFESVRFPRPQLERVLSLDDRARRAEVDWAVEQLVQRHPEMDDAYAARLIEVPFATSIAHRRASLAWLSGRDLEQGQTQRLGVSTGLGEERVVPALQTLGLLATPGAPIVLVFDQLENLMDGESDARVRGYANLVSELFDTMRGVVIVQMVLETEWEEAIKPRLGETQKTRLASRLETLALPTASQRRELVRLWADRLPSPREPFPAPFGEERLARWCEMPGMTPRMLMSECRAALLEGADGSGGGVSERPRAPEDEQAARHDAIAVAWEEHLAAARAGLDESSAERRGADPARLVGGIGCAFRFVPEVSIVTLDARVPIQVRIRKGGRDFALSLLHHKHPKSVASVLDKAGECAASATVLLLRERAIEFPPSWKQTRARLAELSQHGVRFESLEHDDTARLLALESLLCATRSGDVEDERGRALSEEDVGSWVQRDLQVTSWPIVRWLSEAADPSPLDAPRLSRPPERATEARPSVEACLAQLQVASVDRLVREVVRVRAQTTRSDVLEALRDMGSGVRWFGRSIVSRRLGAP